MLFLTARRKKNIGRTFLNDAHGIFKILEQFPIDYTNKREAAKKVIFLVAGPLRGGMAKRVCH